MGHSGQTFKIAGVGEVLWDCFPDHEAFGGAPANFASHCCSLGAEAYVISAVGRDRRGMEAKQFLLDLGVDIAGVADTDYPTGVVNIVLDAMGKPEYDIKQGVAWDYIPWTEALAALCPTLDAICFGSLGQRSPTARATIHKVLTSVPDSCLKVFDINLRQDFYSAEIVRSSLAAADVLKLNDEELPIVADLIGAEGDHESIVRAIVEHFDLKLAVFTLGPKGALMMTPEASSFAVPPDDPVVSTVGAGDSFTAATIMGFLRGRSLAEINEHANLVATFVCTQHGAVPRLPTALVE